MKSKIQLENATLIKRPGYFGSKRDQIIKSFNEKYGKGNWQLYWYMKTNPDTGKPIALTYEDACKQFYERSYFKYLSENTEVCEPIWEQE